MLRLRAPSLGQTPSLQPSAKGLWGIAGLGLLTYFFLKGPEKPRQAHTRTDALQKYERLKSSYV